MDVRDKKIKLRLILSVAAGTPATTLKTVSAHLGTLNACVVN